MTGLCGAREGEGGSSTPLTLSLGLAFIVLPVMVLVLMVPAWEQRAVDAQDAARAAAVALATADDWPSGVAAAEEAAGQDLAANGLDNAAISCAGSLAPGAVVSVTVSVPVPVGELPGLGWVGTLHYSATSAQHVDSYRGSV